MSNTSSLDNPFVPALQIQIDEQVLQFNSALDVAFCLEGRTAVSSSELSELFDLSTEQLTTQAETIADTKKSLLAILSSVAETPDSIEGSIRELDPVIFSQDRDWRLIIQALNKSGEELNPVRTTALSKYVKYLYSLEDAIGDICTDRKKSAGTPVDDNEDATWMPEQIRNESEVSNSNEVEFRRLPYDTEVSARLLPGESLNIRLASYQCQLIATDENVQFVDTSQTTILSKGPNLIGRGPKSTVKIAGAEKRCREHIFKFLSMMTTCFS